MEKRSQDEKSMRNGTFWLCPPQIRFRWIPKKTTMKLLPRINENVLYTAPAQKSLVLNESASSFNVSDLPSFSKRDESREDEPENDSVQPKKSVSFHEVVKSRRIPLASRMREEVRNKIWSSREELQAIKRDTRRLLAKLEENKCSLAIGKEELEGVEYFLCAEQEKRTKVRAESYGAVLDMQDFQDDLWELYQKRGNITEAIARKYSMISEKSLEEALERASRLAMEINSWKEQW